MFPKLGYGIGLRGPHYRDILAGLRNGCADGPLRGLDWFEIISENFFEPGGNPRRVLRAVRERYPVVMHGVALSLGSTDPLDAEYLRRLQALALEIEPALISDHLCWSGVGGHYSHDLLPMPLTEEALEHMAGRVIRVQDFLGRRILIENISSYATFRASTIDEWEFLSALVERADCGILLDVNNVFVSAHNHGYDAGAYIRSLPRGRIGQIHLAGHSERGELLLDTHDHAVREEVWQLYALALEEHGEVSTLVEWDDRIPPVGRVVAEAQKARQFADRSPSLRILRDGAAAP